MFYCNKCGKQIESGIICPECAIAEYEKAQLNKISNVPMPEASVCEPQAPVCEPQAPACEPQAPVCEPQTPVYEPVVTHVPQPEIPAPVQHSDLRDPNNKKFGFTRALLSTIFGGVAFIIMLFSFVLVAVEGYILAMPLLVISIIFGIKSIVVFKKRKNLPAKPVATLILGIVGLAISGTLILEFLSEFLYLF